MTETKDQYYAQEDALPESRDVTLDNFRAQANALADFAPQAAEELNRAQQALDKLWVAAGEQGNTGEQALIQHVWDIEQRQATRVAQLDAARLAAVAVVQKLESDIDKAEFEHKKLEEAIDNIDEDNPLIADLVESVQQDTMDWAQEMAEQGETEYAYDMAWEEVHGKIQHVTGMSWGRVHRFVGFLHGYREITDEQRALMVTLLESFNAEMDEVELPGEDEYEDDDE